MILHIWLLISSRKETEMMAMIWANQIMLGKKTFQQVPRLLREQVAELLRDAGYPELVEE